jgi:prepilin-type processing-associated H-X9-DG protein
MAIIGNTTFAAIGLAGQLSANVTFADGSVQRVDNQATWTTSNAGVATVSSAGFLTAVGFGEADIQATYRGVTNRDISGTAHVIVSAELSPHDCSQESSLRSSQGTTTAVIRFINASSTPREVFWLDYSGQRQLYKTLDPNTRYYQTTFLTHPWLVTGASNNCLAIYLPAAGVATATLR